MPALEFRSGCAHGSAGNRIRRPDTARVHAPGVTASPSLAPLPAAFNAERAAEGRRQCHSEGATKRAGGTFVPGPNEPVGLSTAPYAKGTLCMYSRPPPSASNVCTSITPCPRAAGDPTPPPPGRARVGIKPKQQAKVAIDSEKVMRP